MFDGIAEHEISEREVAQCDCVISKLLIFLFVSFNLFLFNDLIHKC